MKLAIPPGRLGLKDSNRYALCWSAMEEESFRH